MKIEHITKNPLFAQASAALDALLQRRAALQAEFDQLFDGWRYAPAPGAAAILEAVAAGADLPPPRSAHVEAAVARRTQLAQEIAALDRAEPLAREQIERAREQARLRVLDEHAAHVRELRKAYLAALATAARAAQAEDALMAELVSKGYGRHESRGCDEPGVDRAAVLRVLTEREAVAA